MPNSTAPNVLLGRIECAGLWSFFHKDWLLQMRSALRKQLPSNYNIFVESEGVLITPEAIAPAASILPDVSVSRVRNSSQGMGEPSFRPAGTAAVVEVEETCEIETHYSLIIRHARELQIVAAIELLSPSNKGLGNRLDRQNHLRKRTEYLDAGINLLEIDALVHGERDLPPTLSELRDYQRVAWSVAHERGRRRYRGWGWDDGEPLPNIDWHVDSSQAALVELEATLLDAVTFNDWESLVS
jgi:hypothetical protein